MSETGYTGGPAFPQHDLSGYGMGPYETKDGHYRMRGMTLRDWFAGQALPAVIHVCAADTPWAGESRAHMFIRKAYEIADAAMTEEGE